MHSTIFAAAAFAATAAASNAMVMVVNQCDKDTYMTTSHNDGESEILGRFRKEDNFANALKEEGQHEIKASPDGDAWSNAGSQTSLVYVLEGDEVTFDLYNIFGAGYDSLLVEAEGDDECEPIVWADGEQPAGSQSRTCKSEASITLTLCGKPGEKEE